MPAVVKKKVEEVQPSETTSKIKITLERESLARYLSTLSAASSKIIKASQCVFFSVKDNNLTLKSTNLTLYLKYDHGKIDCLDCNFMLPIEYIAPLVSRSNSETVVFEQIDHQRFKVVTDGDYTFSVMDGIEFPEKHDKITNEFMRLDSSDLKEYFRRVSFAISQDVTKSRYLGVYFDGNFTASNGKHIACVESKKEGSFPQILIPRETIDIISKFDGEVILGMNDTNQLVIKSAKGNLTAVSSLLAFETFLPYKSLFSRFKFTNSFEFDVRKMISSLGRLEIFVDEFTSGVYCDMDGKNKKLIMKCGTGNNGIETVDLLNYNGPDNLSFILNHTTLADLMEVSKNKTCKVNFLTENEPFLIEDDNLKFMLTMMVQR